MIMQTFAERELGIGYDPELFTEFSDLNGNDNSSFCWLDPAFGTDLQFSLKPVSVNNTENHYIYDGEENPVDPAHIYTSVFQQYMHGASNLVGWVWADNVFGGAPWLDGCIQRRPGCIIAHQKAILDANRLGPEIVAFNLAEAEVAMLYSPSSLILNRAPYCRDVYDLYRDLAGSGHKITFLSEKQLAEKKFRKVKVLGSPETSATCGATRAAGLEAFVRRGGTVLVSGESFTQDEFGRPLESRFRTERLPVTNRRAVLTETLARLAPPPVTVEIAGAVDPLDVVQIRSVRLPDGRILVNLVNFDRVMHEAAIPLPPGRQARELISGEPVARPLPAAAQKADADRDQITAVRRRWAKRRLKPGTPLKKSCYFPVSCRKTVLLRQINLQMQSKPAYYTGTTEQPSGASGTMPAPPGETAVGRQIDWNGPGVIEKMIEILNLHRLSSRPRIGKISYAAFSSRPS